MDIITSYLTKILSDSLGGKSSMYMILCLSPNIIFQDQCAMNLKISAIAQ